MSLKKVLEKQQYELIEKLHQEADWLKQARDGAQLHQTKVDDIKQDLKEIKNALQNINRSEA